MEALLSYFGINELTMGYCLLTVIVGVFWLWTKTSTGKEWIKNL